ncbi:MAG: CPCC family cysteine-rich protein [Terracidiphilus sp.]
MKFANVSKPAGDKKHACPCCRFLTLDERGAYDICPVCFWEDDGQDDHDVNDVRGGPNYGLSLAQARLNFANIGACEERFLTNVRKPNDSETVPQADL